MKIAIFHDYFRVIGGAEKLVLIMARALNADIITSESNPKVIEKAGYKDLKIINLGKLSKFSILLPNICRKRFSKCDFSKKYDFFIFSGTTCIYAAEKHQPNMWYCNSPLKGIYEKKETIKI